MCAKVLAVDFGTSNSAAAILEDRTPRRIPIELNAETLPTAVFFPIGGEMRIGAAAEEALIAGDEGRYMRALKSILGTSLFHEDRLIGGKRRTLAAIVTAFLVQVKQTAEKETGYAFTQVLSGRPVRFHSADADRDARAETDLKACYLAAGFTDIKFLFEPEAAARTCFEQGKPGETGLIVDIGGGTSDFSVFRTSETGINILASHGIRLGGTDFDREVSMTHVMPLLGHGGQLRRTFGSELLPVPNAIYRELATWAEIPFLYSRDTRRRVDDLIEHAVEPLKMKRLGDVIEDQLGHEMAFSVERGKIATNRQKARAEIDLSFVEKMLSATVTPGSLNASMSGFGEKLRTAMFETLVKAGMSPAEIDTVILVGGSSLMTFVADEARMVCPGAQMRTSDAFTAVVDGLALATAED